MTDSTILDEYADFVEGKIITEGEARIVENALGLAGEVGEVMEKLKKRLRDGTFDVLELQKELGDVLFYLVALHKPFDLLVLNTIRMNMVKLESREERGMIQGSGDNR